jgi:hypothetical protein
VAITKFAVEAARAGAVSSIDRIRRCNGPDPLYQIQIGPVTLAVVDTALAVEPKVDPRPGHTKDRCEIVGRTANCTTSPAE